MEDTVEVNDIDQFATLFTNWHENRMNQLRLIKDAPLDVEILFQNENGEDTPMGEVHRAGFNAGVTVAMSLFEKLPFTMTLIEPEEEPADAE